MEEVNKSGKNQELKRINSSYIIHEIKHLLHLENGFLYTVKQLLLHPGKLVRRFIFENRNTATKPVIFLIFSAALFTFVFHFFHIEYQFISLDQEAGNIGQYSEKKLITDWVNSHIGYSSLMVGFFIAIWIKIFFRKHHYNIYEITILLCYVIGQLLLLVLVFSLLEYISGIKPIAIIGVFAGYVYVFWSIGQFFGERNMMNYVKSVIACFLGSVSFTLVLLFLATIFHHLGIH